MKYCLVGLLVAGSVQATGLKDYTPFGETADLMPGEKYTLLASDMTHEVYSLKTLTGCTGVAVANVQTGYYIRLGEIGCDPDVTRVTFNQTTLKNVKGITFYHRDVMVGYITVKEVK